MTILGQRFPLGDIRQYFKYPVCVPRPGPPPPADKSGRGELMSCGLGMPRASRGDKGVTEGDKGAAGAGRAPLPSPCAVPAGAERLGKARAHPPAGCGAGKAAGAAEAGREPRLPRLLQGCLRDASAAAAGAEQPQSGLQPPG